MASFVGTNKEFNRCIGPRLRNLVQQITRPYKIDIGHCEMCYVRGIRLDAAHKHGSSRKVLIDRILIKYTNQKIITVDLEIFESEFKELHYPINEVILVLCSDCHTVYDRSGNTVDREILNDLEPNQNHILPIELLPEGVEIFKTALLKKKQASIKIEYQDGHSETKNWTANRFTQNSNIYGNLRSRPDFRQGRWQQLNIVKVCVSVN